MGQRGGRQRRGTRSAREPAWGITHACSLCLSAIAIHACSETRELSIRALSAFAIERVASFRSVLLPASTKSSLKFHPISRDRFNVLHAELR